MGAQSAVSMRRQRGLSTFRPVRGSGPEVVAGARLVLAIGRFARASRLTVRIRLPHAEDVERLKARIVGDSSLDTLRGGLRGREEMIVVPKLGAYAAVATVAVLVVASSRLVASCLAFSTRARSSIPTPPFLGS